MGFRARILSAVAAVGLMGTLGGTALAQDEQPVATEGGMGGNFYVAPRLNFGISDVSDFSLSPAQNGSLVQKQDGAEFVAGASLAFGYKWDIEDLPLRIEGQYYYRYHYDLNLRLTQPGGTTVDYDNQTVAHAGILQGYWHIPTGWGIEPYVGLSVGGIYNQTESDRRDNGTGASESIDTDSFQFVFGGGAGIWWDVNDSLAIDVGYRFLDLTDLETDRFSSGERVTTSDYHTHDIYVGVAWKF